MIARSAPGKLSVANNLPRTGINYQKYYFIFSNILYNPWNHAFFIQNKFIW